MAWLITKDLPGPSARLLCGHCRLPMRRDIPGNGNLEGYVHVATGKLECERMRASQLRPIDSWLSDEELKAVDTSDYWNNVELEKTKPWWIMDGDGERCTRYLKALGLQAEFDVACRYIRPRTTGPHTYGANVLDLAAGIGWTSSQISRLLTVGEVHVVEIARHRLGPLFEKCAELFNGDPLKLHRHLGSFYDLHVPDKSVDAVFMSQAFHHAEDPMRLLRECDRVLIPTGRIIMIGEMHVGWKRILRRWAACLLKRGQLTFRYSDLFPVDHTIGDHYYTKRDYDRMFAAIGYGMLYLPQPNGNAVVIAYKPFDGEWAKQDYFAISERWQAEQAAGTATYLA